MKKDKTFLSIRMNSELHDKLKYVAAYEGRSMSRHILHLITSEVRRFEKEHGVIELTGEDET